MIGTAYCRKATPLSNKAAGAGARCFMRVMLVPDALVSGRDSPQISVQQATSGPGLTIRVHRYLSG